MKHRATLLLTLIAFAALLPLTACGGPDEKAASFPTEEVLAEAEDDEEWPEDEEYVEPPCTLDNDCLDPQPE